MEPFQLWPTWFCQLLFLFFSNHLIWCFYLVIVPSGIALGRFLHQKIVKAVNQENCLKTEVNLVGQWIRSRLNFMLRVKLTITNLLNHPCLHKPQEHAVTRGCCRPISKTQKQMYQRRKYCRGSNPRTKLAHTN